MKISALAITLNEAEHVESYIASLWFADEIIIVDSHSEDATRKLAAKHDKVTVLTRDFDNFSAQKNFAIAQAKNDWIVFFDLDEEITRALSEEIVKTLEAPRHIAYYVKRDFYFMGTHLKYSGYQNDFLARVFNKKHCNYNANLVHEVLDINGSSGRLKGTLPHHTYKSFDHYMSKLHQYSELQAKMLYAKKKKPTMFHFLVRPWYRFWHQYILRLGILDGKEGFILAYVSAFSVFKRYVNLWLLYRKIK